jgi:uncharacterized membrane protein
LSKQRLEAFSDGVMAVIITIMVLEMKAPQGAGWEALRPVRPVFLSYVLSFVFLGIYWSNHHHLLQTVRRVSGRVLWANMHLLFWLSLTPFATAWMGQSFGPWSVALYGFIQFCAGIAYYILSHILISLHGKDSTIASALGRDFKGKISVVLYALAIPAAFLQPVIACAVYVLVAGIWFIPDRRIERSFTE